MDGDAIFSWIAIHDENSKYEQIFKGYLLQFVEREISKAFYPGIEIVFCLFFFIIIQGGCKKKLFLKGFLQNFWREIFFPSNLKGKKLPGISGNLENFLKGIWRENHFSFFFRKFT